MIMMINLVLSVGVGLVESDHGFALSLVPITRTNMMCTGFENSISQCSFDGATGNSDCDHSDDILIICSRK